MITTHSFYDSSSGDTCSCTCTCIGKSHTSTLQSSTRHRFLRSAQRGRGPLRAPSNLQKRVVSAYECRPPPFAPVAAGAARPRPLVDSDKVPARRFGGGDGVLIARTVVELEAQRRLAERLACPSPRPPSRVGTRLQSARSAPATVDTPRGSARSARPRETPNSARRCTSQKA